MKLLYEAANSIEAHMILNLLEQANLSARIDGEYLQGGIGELPAMGVVRVMVEEGDFVEAKSIVQQWDEKQPIAVAPASARKPRGVGAGIIGFACGILAMIVYYQTPVTNDGIDYNGDGALDENWEYVNYRASETTADRNFDGSVDVVHTYNRRGVIDGTKADDDFNGSFETELSYEHGNAYRQKTDTTGDGVMDYLVSFTHGLVDTVTFLDVKSGKPIKIQSYGAFKLKQEQVDTTGDGVLETVNFFDSTESIVPQMPQ